MTKFNITTHKFTLDNEEYFLKPLNGEHIDLLFSVLATFQDVNDTIEAEMPKDISDKEREKISSSKFLTSLPKGVLKDLHTLTMATFKGSYPEKKDEDLNAFVTQNLFKLMNHVIKASMPAHDEE